MDNSETSPAVRIDKWLWAARFFKTRALAVEAITGGKVQVNCTRAKRSKLVHAGDQVRIRKGPYEYQITVRVAAERRGSAKDSALFYEESDESRVARERLVEQHRLVARTFSQSNGRPPRHVSSRAASWRRSAGVPSIVDARSTRWRAR